MNQPASLKDRLDRAKRELDKAVQAVTRLMLSDNGLGINRRYVDSTVGNALYYFHANAINGAGFGKRVQNVRKEFAALPAGFDTAVDYAYWHYSNVENLKKLRDAEVAAKRAGVKAKADLKTRLNLQEGVKLQGVDVGQYEVILAGLEPVRLHAQASRREQLASLFIAIKRKLNEHGGRVELAYPDANNPRYGNAPEFFNEFFREISNSVGREYEERPSNERSEFIRKESARFALAYIQGYAVKLALKTGEQIANDPKLAGYAPVSASVSSDNLWIDSIARIVLERAAVIPVGGTGKVTAILRFHTQMIWNQSVYGLQFNQFPTRRID